MTIQWLILLNRSTHNNSFVVHHTHLHNSAWKQRTTINSNCQLYVLIVVNLNNLACFQISAHGQLKMKIPHPLLHSDSFKHICSIRYVSCMFCYIFPTHDINLSHNVSRTRVCFRSLSSVLRNIVSFNTLIGLPCLTGSRSRCLWPNQVLTVLAFALTICVFITWENGSSTWYIAPEIWDYFRYCAVKLLP